MTTATLSRPAAPNRLLILAVTLLGLSGGLIAGGVFGAWVGAQVGQTQKLTELQRLCDRMPDVAVENPSMCTHIRASLT